MIMDVHMYMYVNGHLKIFFMLKKSLKNRRGKLIYEFHVLLF